jgi:hypothetical protein
MVPWHDQGGLMKKNVKKLELAKETVRVLDLGGVRGGANHTNALSVPEGSCSCHTDPISSGC